VASEYADRIRTRAAEARRARRAEPGACCPDLDADPDLNPDADPHPDPGRDPDRDSDPDRRGGARPAAEAEPRPDAGRETGPLAAARDGLGPVVGLYVEARAAERGVRLSAAELDLLHRATNDWLAVYAARHGVAVDPDATVRAAAELLLDTHDITEVAALLTGVPED